MRSVVLAVCSSQCNCLCVQMIIHHYVFSRTMSKLLPLGILYFLSTILRYSKKIKETEWVGRKL